MSKSEAFIELYKVTKPTREIRTLVIHCENSSGGAWLQSSIPGHPELIAQVARRKGVGSGWLSGWFMVADRTIETEHLPYQLFLKKTVFSKRVNNKKWCFLSLTFGHFHVFLYNSVGAFCWFLSFILPLYKLGNAKYPQNSIVSDTEFPFFFYTRLGTIVPKKFAAATVFPPFSSAM